MYRNNEQILSNEEHNFVINHAALGDMISSLPAIVKARQFSGEAMKLHVWVPPWQMDLVRHLLAPYGTFDVCDMTKLPKDKKGRAAAGIIGPVSLNSAINNTHTRCRTHMVDFAFSFLINAQPENMRERSYVTEAPLGERTIEGKYVVFPVGATSDNKLFKAAVMQPIMEWCLENGYRPVIGGTKTSHTQAEVNGELQPIVIREQSSMLSADVFKRCLDARESTTLLQLRDVLGHASAVVGVDGGTLHLAGTTDTNIVFASGTTLPKHRYIARRGDPSYKIRYVGPRDLECTGCQSQWPLVTFDFRFCVYGDNKCMDQLHPDDFINGLKDLGL